MKPHENLMIVADSDNDANMLYATGMFVPDAFIYLRLRGRNYIVMSDLEIDRARKQAPHCHVLSLTRFQKKLRRDGMKNPGLADVIPMILRPRGIRRVTVPQNFPCGLAVELQRRRIRVKPSRGNIFPEREFKSAVEVKKISAALMMAEVGMAEAIQVLRASKIGRDRRLMHHNLPLTSEKLRAVIETAIIRANGVANHTIVAGGKQACDPHEGGYGPLRAHEPIILDIFPRSQKTGYFGDITRTVVRGRASEAARKLYDTVFRAQQAAFEKMTAGTKTTDVHKVVEELFKREGYKTGKVNGRMQGFFHGTGHGLGMEIHEPPRTGQHSPGVLKVGQVVTVEPGLYYPAIGGVRLEDVALVTPGRPRNLTQFEKVLEL
jgi:Xaa-Pro aminopeptidase